MKRTTKSLYLNKIKFDPKLKKGFIHHLITNPRLTILAILTLTIGGLFSFFSLPRELNPQVDIAIINIITTLPGASPTDVESLVTEKIETELLNLESLDVINSTSSDSLSVITLQFLSTLDADKALDLTKEKVDLVDNLPEDVSTPRIQKLDFNDQAVWSLALVSPTNRHSLTQIAEDIKAKLEATPGIRKVDLSGNENQEIVISLRPDTLLVHQVSPTTIANTLKSQNLTIPAGSLTVSGLDYSLTVNNDLNQIQRLRSLPIPTNSSPLPLGELADVHFASTDSTQRLSFTKDGQTKTAIQLDVFKSDTETIAGAVEKTTTLLEQEILEHPDLSYQTIINFAEDTQESFTELASNFRATILLVFLTLFVFLGLRQAVTASLSIPLAFLSTFIIMNLSGITLNFLSLFSLLLALGLVVDDAIVIVQAISKYSLRFSPIQTGLLVFRDFVVPIWTTTLTTVWAFVPLLLATGIIGEFIKSIPVVVTATLLSSTAIAVLINLPLTITLSSLKLPKRAKILLWLLVFLAIGSALFALTSASPLSPAVLILYLLLTIILLTSHRPLSKALLTILRNFTNSVLPKSHPRSKANSINKIVHYFKSSSLIKYGPLNFTPIARTYHNILDQIITHKKTRLAVYAVSSGLIITSIIFQTTGLLKNEFFPKIDSNNIFINLQAPAGWTTDQVESALIDIRDQISSTPEIDTIFLTTGSTFDPNFTATGKNLGQLSVILVNQDDRSRSSIAVADDLRSQVARPNSLPKITVFELSGGPPAGAEFQVNLRGQDLQTLEVISNDFVDILSEIEGAINAQSSLTLSAGQINIQLDQTELSQRSLSAAEVGSWLRTAVNGSKAGDVIINGEEIDFTLNFRPQDLSLANLQNLTLPGTLGPYSLNEIAKLELENSPTKIEREDGQRVVRVTAGTSGTSSQQLLQKFNARTSNYSLPAGYTWDTGGENEENERSVASIIQAMGVSAILILITMVLQLQSFRKALLVLSVIPLAIAGVFFNFTVFGIPLSFPALIGVLALFGIVVNNSIMLVEKINQNLKQNFAFHDAITDACTSRLEPILLTTLTTSFGLLPVTLSDPLWRGLGGAIIAGLSVSGFLILFLLPALFYETFKPAKQTH